MKKGKNKQKRGYTLIIVLILMSILLTMAYFFSEGLFTELIIARNNKGAAVAFSLAEAGVQDAIYRVQYDDTIKNTFMNSDSGTMAFARNPALISQGSYLVEIRNSAKGVAMITSTGKYAIGPTRAAQRVIKVGIAQANPNPYIYDGAIFAGGGSGESIADVDVWYANLNIYGGSIFSNRDMNLKFGAHTNVEDAVEANRNIIVSDPSLLNCHCLIGGAPLCSENPGCTFLEGAPPKLMPPVDFSSPAASSYLNQAKEADQYFVRASDFLALAPEGASTTFNGVVYIDDSLVIDSDRAITINGVLATTGSISINQGSITITRPDAISAAGVLTQKDLKVAEHGNLTGTGLIYTGDRCQIDSSVDLTFDLYGGILSRRVWLTGFRNVNIHFESNVINATLSNAVETPVIEINHWEEEY